MTPLQRLISFPLPLVAGLLLTSAALGQGLVGDWQAMGPGPATNGQVENITPDDQASMSIGALEFDPTDGTHQTLVAGIGRYSSFGRRGGARTGLLQSTEYHGLAYDAVSDIVIGGAQDTGTTKSFRRPYAWQFGQKNMPRPPRFLRSISLPQR